MSNRCPDCNKFVHLDLAEPEVEVGDLDQTDDKKACLNLTIKLTQQCAECGTELMQKEIETNVWLDLTGFEEV